MYNTCNNLERNLYMDMLQEFHDKSFRISDKILCLMEYLLLLVTPCHGH